MKQVCCDSTLNAPMKVAVLTDVHANLPALKAALRAIQRECCDLIYHTGDAIGIGPYPAECLDLLLNTSQVHLLMGNHDAWFAFGLPELRPSWMSEGELEHHHWVHSCLGLSLRSVVAQWPYVIQEEFEGVQVTFVHYGLNDSERDFVSIIGDPGPDDLNRMFARHQSMIVFYGHHHPTSDVEGQARYVNPGSVGCHTESVARFVILECAKGSYKLEKHVIAYDDTGLFQEFERRNVPERDFICQVFFGRKQGIVS
jgi:predicted phosphodiesterase